MRQGVALVISAPSGAGKSTLSKMLLAEFSNFAFSVSCCTRPMRKGEVDGKDYFFISREDFERRREAGEFAEWAEVHGNLYGTPLKPARENLEKGKDMLFDVDVQGAAQIKISLPEAKFIFILPPSLAELERRLLARGLDGPESLAMRLRNAKTEIREASWYDALVVNANIEQAYESLRAIYLAYSLAPARNGHLLQRLLAEKAEFQEGAWPSS